MADCQPYFLQKRQLYAIPVIHYNMEMAAQVKIAFDKLRPDCVAVEFPQTMQSKILHAASRLPDISVILTYQSDYTPIYFMCEPCDPLFEALRSASEARVDSYCIDLDVDRYPDIREFLPDPYAVHRLGLKIYYEAYIQSGRRSSTIQSHLDQMREIHMARHLKELCLRYDKVLFVGGMAHIASIFKFMDQSTFPKSQHIQRETIELCTLTQESCCDILAEWGYLSAYYEKMRQNF